MTDTFVPGKNYVHKEEPNIVMCCWRVLEEHPDRVKLFVSFLDKGTLDLLGLVRVEVPREGYKDWEEVKHELSEMREPKDPAYH